MTPAICSRTKGSMVKDSRRCLSVAAILCNSSNLRLSASAAATAAGDGVGAGCADTAGCGGATD